MGFGVWSFYVPSVPDRKPESPIIRYNRPVVRKGRRCITLAILAGTFILVVASCAGSSSAPTATPVCGDGFIDIEAGEQCDGGPGCSPMCTLEPTDVALCDDGFIDIEAGEQCDGGPGCSPTCTLEPTDVGAGTELPSVFPIRGAGDALSCEQGIATWAYTISSWTSAGIISGGNITFVRCSPADSRGYTIFRYNIANTGVSLLNTNAITGTGSKTSEGSFGDNRAMWDTLPDEQEFTINISDPRETSAKVYIGTTEYPAVQGTWTITPDLSE